LGTLVPVIGLVQVGAQAHADRYTYIPSIGLFLMAVWAIDEMARRWRCQKAVVGLSAVVLAILMLHSFGQISYWRDEQALWQHALDACGESTVAHTNLATALLEKGDPRFLREALQHDRAAVRIDPSNFAAHNQLGVILFDLGEKVEAFRHWREAIRLQPEWEQ